MKQCLRHIDPSKSLDCAFAAIGIWVIKRYTLLVFWSLCTILLTLLLPSVINLQCGKILSTSPSTLSLSLTYTLLNCTLPTKTVGIWFSQKFFSPAFKISTVERTGSLWVCYSIFGWPTYCSGIGSPLHTDDIGLIKKCFLHTLIILLYLLILKTFIAF